MRKRWWRRRHRCGGHAGRGGRWVGPAAADVVVLAVVAVVVVDVTVAASPDEVADVEVAEQVWVMVQVRALEAAQKPADRRRSSDQRRADMAICAA